MAHPKSNIIRENFGLVNSSLLKKKDFNIKNLITDTGYKPKETTNTLFKMFINYLYFIPVYNVDFIFNYSRRRP